MKQYAIYLRKSRADLDAEARSEGETLARHRRALTDLAEKRGLNVTHIYEEIASGSTIASRPQMQALLAAVEAGEYAGVIVNDTDRLTRGNGTDQDIIKQAFYTTGTLIITPLKTFDPADESDEDFFDISMFFSQFGLRKINRRLQTGRKRSAAEGNYLGSRPVFGYRRVKRPDRSGWTLEPVEEDAEIVRMIFRWYAYGDNGQPLGSWLIADRLNAMGVRTLFGHAYEPDRVRKILTNPIYIGQVSWNKRTKCVRTVNGQREITREHNPAPIIVEDAHPAIVDRDLWDKVQEMMTSHAKLPKNKCARVSNVLAGLVRCSCCGRAMQRKPGAAPGRPDIIYCTTRGCPTTAIAIPIVEEALLDVLDGWRVRYSAPQSKTDAPAANPERAAAEKQLITLRRQMDNLHDLLEQGIYTPQVFIRRRDDLAARIDATTQLLHQASHQPTRADLIRAELPQIEHVLQAYPLTHDLEQRNALLKSVISHVIYTKTEHCYRNQNPADYLTLDIYPKGVK